MLSGTLWISGITSDFKMNVLNIIIKICDDIKIFVYWEDHFYLFCKNHFKVLPKDPKSLWFTVDNLLSDFSVKIMFIVAASRNEQQAYEEMLRQEATRMKARGPQPRVSMQTCFHMHFESFINLQQRIHCHGTLLNFLSILVFVLKLCQLNLVYNLASPSQSRSMNCRHVYLAVVLSLVFMCSKSRRRSMVLFSTFLKLFFTFSIEQISRIPLMVITKSRFSQFLVFQAFEEVVEIIVTYSIVRF